MNSFIIILSVLFFGQLYYTETKSISNTFRVRLNKNGEFIDNYQRVRIFHGFNNVEKDFPWYDKQILNMTKLKFYKEWGFNIVRLGTMWSGIEPAEGVYNETYIGILKEIVAELQEFGIYSLLDMHQDILSSKFGTYDGAPLWLINKFPGPPDQFKFPFPLNPKKTYPWAANYFTYAASDAFENLYKNEIGLFYWTRFWQKVSSVFSKNLSVIGYELINEPWIGNFYKHVELLMPGYAGKHNLLPAYDRIVEAIRKIDNDTLIFYEPVTFGSYYPTTGNLGTGFDRVPGGADHRDKSVLSYHYYCFLLTTKDPANNYSTLDRALCDDFFAKNLFKSTLENVQKTGGGKLLTEFGICSPDGNPDSINTVECEAVLKMADEHLQSFTYWDSEFFDSNGNVQPTVVKSFARTYPRALQGQPVEYSFNTTNASFKLVFIINLNINAPTEIFVPQTVHYPKGFTNITVPFMKTSFDKENFIFIVSPMKNIPQNSTVTVQIERIL